MQLLSELGEAVAVRRKALGLRQGAVARQAGINPVTLSLFERGRVTELGVRKLLAVLAVLDLEMQFADRGAPETLDDLRRERSGL